jgi:DNA-binding MarR family transcriptional regulator/N-acetylglutamate synthase-like GNAT family acetyltransferase
MAPATTAAREVPSARIDAVREFNRFYTRVLGLLDEGLLRTAYTLTEARVLFDLGHGGPAEVTQLRRELGLDAGYLSRMLARFEESGLVERARSEHDARRQLVRLTANGRKAYRMLDRRSAREVGALLRDLPGDGQRRLVAAMRTIAGELGERKERDVALRAPGPGDLGWIVERHGTSYAAEYGFDERFEILVARIVADFAADRDPDRDAAWIATADGDRAGCILCVRDTDTVAKLRLLWVEPSARGLGIGTRLVEQCVDFARAAGYRELVLWTNDVLTHARPIYDAAGFELAEEEPHAMFGPRIVGQTMRLAL